MAGKQAFDRAVRRTAFLTVGLVAALVFGMIVLIGGDWVPGTVIVVAAAIGLVQQILVVRRLCGDESSRPTRHEPAH